jgi:hypothetical protein
MRQPSRSIGSDRPIIPPSILMVLVLISGVVGYRFGGAPAC